MAARTSDKPVQKIAIQSPQRPGMRPDGIGRPGSLIASTWRSNQSFVAWLVAQIAGPASTTPARVIGQWWDRPTPDDTTPHRKAHIGGNQVIGLSSSSTAEPEGTRPPGCPTPTVKSAPLILCVVGLTFLRVNYFGQSRPAASTGGFQSPVSGVFAMPNL